MGVQSFGNPGASFRNRFGRTGKRAANEVRFSATGGDVSAGFSPGNGYKYHVWTSPGTFITQGGVSKNIEFLVIGGGGGSGWDAAGGGGAGGVRTNTVPGDPMNITTTINVPGSDTITITVGPGGTHITSPGPGPSMQGNPGGNSSIGSPGNPYFILASGGGGSGNGEDPATGANGGGSGGGGGWRTWPGGNPFPAPPSTNTVNGSGPSVSSPDGLPGIQGFAGGYGVGLPSSRRGGGGGGGAGGAGSNAPGIGGAGGPGRAFPAFSYPLISPLIPAPLAPTFGPTVGPTGLYAGGGQGGGDETGNLTTRTPGGGGIAQRPPAAGLQPATDCTGISGTGSGGGGAGGNTGRGVGGDGGPGIVIIRYLV